MERTDGADPAARSAGAPPAGPCPDLRQRAEEEGAVLEARDRISLSPDDTRRLLHELRVHQIELELQNEELRRAQLELEISHARFHDLYELAPVGYFMLSEEGLILQANLTAASLLGVARGQLIDQPLTRFIVPEDSDNYYLLRRRLGEAA